MNYKAYWEDFITRALGDLVLSWHSQTRARKRAARILGHNPEAAMRTLLQKAIPFMWERGQEHPEHDRRITNVATPNIIIHVAYPTQRKKRRFLRILINIRYNTVITIYWMRKNTEKEFFQSLSSDERKKIRAQTAEKSRRLTVKEERQNWKLFYNSVINAASASEAASLFGRRRKTRYHTTTYYLLRTSYYDISHSWFRHLPLP